MGTYYRRPSNFVQSCSTGLITVPTSPATLINISSGCTFMVLSNIGPSTIAWGGSNVTASSGGLLFYSMNDRFDSPVYVIANSVAGVIARNEFFQ